MRQQDYGTRFAHDTQEGDASEVVAVAPAAFVFVQGDDLGISHVL